MKIVLSFVAAFLLVLLPLPGWATMYRPDWVVLVLIYWCLVEPERVGPVAGWVVGLAVDITQNFQAAADDFFTSTFGHVDPSVGLVVRGGCARAGGVGGLAVVFAGFGDAVTLFGFVSGDGLGATGHDT